MLEIYKNLLRTFVWNLFLGLLAARSLLNVSSFKRLVHRIWPVVRFHFLFVHHIFRTCTASFRIINLLLLSRVVLLLELLMVGYWFLLILQLSVSLFFLLFILKLRQQCMPALCLHSLSVFNISLHVSVIQLPPFCCLLGNIPIS